MKKVILISLLVITVLSFVIPLAFGDMILTSMLPKQEKQEGITVINTIKNGSIDDISNLFSSDVKKEMSPEKISELKEYLKENDIRDYALFNSNINFSGNSKVARLMFQAKFNDQWALVSMELHGENNIDKLYGINVQPMEKSLQEVYKVSLTDRPIINYIVLVLSVAFAFLNFYAFNLVLNLKIKNKWLWAIISFSGICSFTLDWSTGVYSFNPVAIGLPCFTYSKFGSYSPLTIGLYFPIGALIFLGVKWRLINNAANKAEPETDDSDLEISNNERN